VQSQFPVFGSGPFEVSRQFGYQFRLASVSDPAPDDMSAFQEHPRYLDFGIHGRRDRKSANLFPHPVGVSHSSSG